MANKEGVLKVLATIGAAYPHHNVTRDTVALYADLLADIDPAVLRLAALKHIAGSKWYPTVAELRSAATDLTRPRIRTGAEAWGDVLSEVKRVGSYKAPAFADPVTARVVAGIGWQNICMSEDMMADRAHFIKAYEASSKRDADEAQQLPEIRALVEKLSAPGAVPQIAAAREE